MVSHKNCSLLLSRIFKSRMKLKSFSTTTSNQEYSGAQLRWSEELEFTGLQSYQPISTYQVLNQQGQILKESEDPKLNHNMLEKMYKNMSLVNFMDKILYESQRQGRISFYLTSFGEEATQTGSAAALTDYDLVYGQYREVGVLLWRGCTLSDITNQCYGNIFDRNKGRQMPLHLGSQDTNFITLSSPLATQMPQSAGAAYALKGKNRVVICYFGEGAASEGDAHAAFNFAATLNCPVIFFCRNNGYAISTPTDEQYKGDGIAARGPGYGINTLRVDGNDVFAVYNATKKAKEYALAENKPVLIEALTYRVGHHTTSDDSSAYRSLDEVKYWATQKNPIKRFRLYLEDNNLWNEDMENKWMTESRNNVLSALEAAEKTLKPHWSEMFNDVYKDTPQHIRTQMAEVSQHLEQYKDKYPLKDYANE